MNHMNNQTHEEPPFDAAREQAWLDSHPKFTGNNVSAQFVSKKIMYAMQKTFEQRGSVIFRAAPVAITESQHQAPRRTRRTTRSSAKSGDSNSEPEPEPERNQLYDQASLADLLCISQKTLQNIYSKTPHLLPPAIQIPGARGPRWTPQAVQEWLSNRPQHTPKTVVVAPRRKVGRPRIALAGKGGAA